MRVYSHRVLNKGLFTKVWAGCEDTTRDSAVTRTGNCGAVTTLGRMREQFLEPGDRWVQADGPRTGAVTFS